MNTVTAIRLRVLRRPIHLLTMAVALALAVTANGQDGVDPIIPGRAVARVADGFSIAQLIAAFESAHPPVTLSVLDQIPGRPTYHLSYVADGIDDELVGDWLEAFAAHPSCVWAEISYEGQAPESKTGSTWTDSVDDASLYFSQYAVDMLGIPQAHQRTTGAGVTIAILDTGVDASHPQLAGAVIPGGYNFILDSASTDEIGNGHGTYVAGLIRLVAPDARLLPIVVLDADGKGDGWLFARGVYHAIDHGVRVINLSLGSTYKFAAVEDAIDEAETLGIIVVSAAGNFDREEPEEFPAAMSDGLGVAAVDHMDLKASFSNYHSKLFISAPGASGATPATAIYSTVPGNAFAVWEGTSFSTAFVSGAVALLLSQHPEWGCDRSTIDLVEATFESTVVNIDGLNPEYEELLGVGRLDLAQLALGGPIAPATGDLNNDGTVDGADLGILLASWGAACGSADLNGDGTVDGLDLGMLLLNWTG